MALFNVGDTVQVIDGGQIGVITEVLLHSYAEPTYMVNFSGIPVEDGGEVEEWTESALEAYTP